MNGGICWIRRKTRRGDNGYDDFWDDDSDDDNDARASFDMNGEELLITMEGEWIE